MMLGGAWYDKLVDRLGDLKESTIQDYACKVLSEQLDIKTEPSNVVVTIQKVGFILGNSRPVEILSYNSSKFKVAIFFTVLVNDYDIVLAFENMNLY